MTERRVEVYQRIKLGDGEVPQELRYEGTLIKIIKDDMDELCGIVITPDGYLEDVYISLLRVID